MASMASLDPRHPLPTLRQMLTSIVHSITSIPAPPEDARKGGNYEAQRARSKATTASTANPLSLIPAAHRPLFTALHAMYPQLLLPALDLLDRGLVSRLELAGGVGDASDGIGGDNSSSGGGGGPAQVYHVRSAQQQHQADGGRRRRGHHHRSDGGGESGGGPAYLVRLGAWNCSCAAFAFSAFSAFPGTEGGGLFAPETGIEDEAAALGPEELTRAGANPGPVREAQQEQPDTSSLSWQFGGLSLDGTPGLPQGKGVPCCKHLLACLLADRWQPLARFVIVRKVGRTEMAGTAADV